jgi:hypothetical protein
MVADEVFQISRRDPYQTIDLNGPNFAAGDGGAHRLL